MWHFKIVDGVHGTAWAFSGRIRAEVSCIIGLWRRFVTEVRGSAELQEELKAGGLGPMVERWQGRGIGRY